MQISPVGRAYHPKKDAAECLAGIMDAKIVSLKLHMFAKNRNTLDFPICNFFNILKRFPVNPSL